MRSMACWTAVAGADVIYPEAERIAPAADKRNIHHPALVILMDMALPS
jgi:hypothetical protein